MTTVPTPLESEDLPRLVHEAMQNAPHDGNLYRQARAAIAVLRAQQVRDAARGARPCSFCEVDRADHPADGTCPSPSPAPVSPGGGPLVGDKYLVERAASAIGTAIIHGHRQARDLARAALRTVDAHLATRALRPAREVAHEAAGEHFDPTETPTADERWDDLVSCATAAIERDRAGGRR